MPTWLDSLSCHTSNLRLVFKLVGFCSKGSTSVNSQLAGTCRQCSVPTQLAGLQQPRQERVERGRMRHSCPLCVVAPLASPSWLFFLHRPTASRPPPPAACRRRPPSSPLALPSWPSLPLRTGLQALPAQCKPLASHVWIQAVYNFQNITAGSFFYLFSRWRISGARIRGPAPDPQEARPLLQI